MQCQIRIAFRLPLIESNFVHRISYPKVLPSATEPNLWQNTAYNGLPIAIFYCCSAQMSAKHQKCIVLANKLYAIDVATKVQFWCPWVSKQWDTGALL